MAIIGMHALMYSKKDEATRQFAEVVRLNPNNSMARLALDQLMKRGKTPGPGGGR